MSAFAWRDGDTSVRGLRAGRNIVFKYDVGWLNKKIDTTPPKAPLMPRIPNNNRWWRFARCESPCESWRSRCAKERGRRRGRGRDNKVRPSYRQNFIPVSRPDYTVYSGLFNDPLSPVIHIHRARPTGRRNPACTLKSASSNPRGCAPQTCSRVY